MADYASESFDCSDSFNLQVLRFGAFLGETISKVIYLLPDGSGMRPSLENPPGCVANWGYPNTDGLVSSSLRYPICTQLGQGLLEYLNWVEDLGAEPILGVWDGISPNNYSDLSTWNVIPEANLQPYIDDVLNEIDQ